jgi:hypothetical protein
MIISFLLILPLRPLPGAVILSERAERARREGSAASGTLREAPAEGYAGVHAGVSCTSL